MDDKNTEAIKEAFGKVLRLKRKALGLSQEELAARSGIAMRYVSLLECNQRQPTISTLYRLSQGLEVSLAEFVSEIEEETIWGGIKIYLNRSEWEPVPTKPIESSWISYISNQSGWIWHSQNPV